MIFTPDMNDGHTLFVFGSNESGQHLGGAAREALIHWGARPGQGFGPAGFSFAIPTMNWEINVLPLSVIKSYVERFLAYAEQHPTTRFLVTPVGTGICGYSRADSMPMFVNAPNSCILPDGWRK